MRYEEAALGRAFILKFEHGDNFLEDLKSFAKEKNILAGTVQFIGALARAGVVTGPEKDELPVTPIWDSIDKANEVVGTGTIFWESGEPKLHIHSSAGHGKDTLVACIRKDTEVFIVLEAIVQEYTGTGAKRVPDEKTGMSLLSLGAEPRKY